MGETLHGFVHSSSHDGLHLELQDAVRTLQERLVSESHGTCDEGQSKAAEAETRTETTLDDLRT